MSTLQAFESSIKNFLSTSVLYPLAEISVDNRDCSVEQLVEKFIETLGLSLSVPEAKTACRKRSPKSSSPKTEQQWLTFEKYSECCDDQYLCGYVQTRGKYKDHYCGVTLDNTNVVSWSKETNFVASTPEKELVEVDNKRGEMRCKMCWARDPKTGEYKRKKGRGDKLVSEHKGDIVAPSVIPGVSVPDNEGLMGFLSGNSKTFVSPTRAMDAPKKVIRAKRFPGLMRNEEFSNVLPNPEHHDMSWLILSDSEGQVVIGKFDFKPSSTTTFEDGYVDDLVPLDDEDLALCKEYNIEYKFYQKPQDDTDDIDIPIVHEREDDTTTIQDIPDVPTLEIDDLINNLAI